MKDSQQPYVICHMMCTLDGKIASGIKDVNLLDDDYFQTYTDTEDQLGAHAWMIGRVTMEMFATGTGTPLPKAAADFDDQDFIAPHTNDNFALVIDTKGTLRWAKNTIPFSNVSDPVHLVVIVTAQTSKEYLSYLRSLNISYLFGGDQTIDFAATLKTLKHKLGIEKLLLEGGAILNGSVIAQDQIDEISLLLCPLVVNRSSAPSVFENSLEGPLSVRKFALTSVQQSAKDTIWLRYVRKEK